MLNFRVTDEESALLAAYSQQIGQSMTDVIRTYIRSLEGRLRRVVPETIEPYLLPSIPLVRTDIVPPVAAVYFIMTEAGEVLYVGHSANLSLRHLDHHRHDEAVAIDSRVRLHWHEKRAARENFERACIRRFKPRLNTKPRG